MYTQFFLQMAFALSAGFSNHATTHEPSPTELLTFKEWVMEAQGYDLNKNGSIDNSEEIQDYRKGDLYVFKPNGTGIFFNEGFSCEGLPEQSFTWKLLKNGSLLDLGIFSVPVLRLDEKELVLYRDEKLFSGRITRYMSIFRHIP